MSEDKSILLEWAKNSIKHKLDSGSQTPLPVELSNFPENLILNRASFVTLFLNGNLRGCIGTLEPYRPLLHDVIENACSAAFSDPRFPPLTISEFKQLEIHISVLSLPESMDVDSEKHLLDQLRPGVDGLILQDKGIRATFLPSVWESLPEPKQFIQQLKLKAQLPIDYWSNSIRFFRYATESFF